MLIAAVLCLCAAAAFIVIGARALAGPAPVGGAQQILRSVAPTQLAAAVMLAAGGVVALSQQHSVGLLALCIAGAVATIAAGTWQGARFVQETRQRAACERSGGPRCAACTLSCH